MDFRNEILACYFSAALEDSILGIGFSFVSRTHISSLSSSALNKSIFCVGAETPNFVRQYYEDNNDDGD